ncbi:MAG TPA: dihydrofolate reductase family protein, partial [Xanthomonadaceae bacterium]|nr:dihydrofolate reductase family protein [Xanthomonadaceae bacterium]
PKYVVSNTLESAPWGDADDRAEVLRGDGVEATRVLRKRIDGDIIVWGSLTLADALLRAAEVDVLRLRIVPVLIGAGRSFSPHDLGQRALAFEQAQTFPSGHVVLQYRMT